MRDELIEPEVDGERRVLIVDDDKDFAESLADVLEAHGYECEVADHTEEVEAVAEGEEATVALVDLRLGSRCGLDFVSEMQDVNPDMMCVMMSAYADVESAIQALRGGVSAFLRKPITEHELLVTLNGCFEKMWLKREKQVAEKALARANTELQAKNTKLAELATLDDLTGLYNRRQFLELLNNECERTRRYGSSTSLAMVDIDHFKAINDTHGHAFGDWVLFEVADFLKKTIRASDIVARYGGDEFMIIMPGTNAEEAFQGAERIRRQVAQRVISAGQSSPQVTVSIGVSTITAGACEMADTFINRADKALYAAKSSGRNCTQSWETLCGDELAKMPLQDEAIEDYERRLEGLSEMSRDTYIRSVQGLCLALEERDPYTTRHSQNVTQYATGIAEMMRLIPKDVEAIRRAAMIHDIGKIGIPDAILQKPGALTAQERNIMEQHVMVGVRILSQLRFLDREIPIIRHHHERWDGKGYPDGIAGAAIPVGARVLTVADSFDAMTSDRVYRKAYEVSTALDILKEESGKQFNLEAVSALSKWVQESAGMLEKTGLKMPSRSGDGSGG